MTVGIVLVQLISNDKFKSVTHRVLANQVGPRISVACFFGPQQLGNRLYGPLKELLSDDNPPLYREILVREYLAHYASKGISKSALAHFRLRILKEVNERRHMRNKCSKYLQFDIKFSEVIQIDGQSLSWMGHLVEEMKILTSAFRNCSFNFCMKEC